MQLTKPNATLPVTYLTARRKGARESKTITLYGATPLEAIEDYRKFVEARARRTGRAKLQPASA